MPFSDFLLRQKLLNQGVNPYSGAAGPSTPGAAGPPPGLLGRLSAAAFPVGDASGLLDPQQQRAAQQQGLLGFGASLLANSGPQPGPRQGFGSLVGQALLQGQGAARGGINDQLQQLLLKAKIQDAERGPAAGQDPALVAEFKYAKTQGFTGSFQDYIKSKQSPVQQPSAIQEAEYFAKLTPEQQRQYLEVKRAQATPFQQTEQGGATGAFDRRSGAFTPQVAPEQNQAAAAALKAAEAGGAAGGKIDAERAATFQQDLNVIDDEILRTQRLLTEFKGGKYQTGPIAGRFPNVRTPAQNLKRESAKDTIKGISSATFGSLTEGERKFIQELGINEINNEESNIDLLEERLTGLQKAKLRLQTRGPVAPASGVRAAPAAAGTRPPLSSFRR